MLNIVLNGVLYGLGIRPRNVHHLPMIFTAPFIHGSWQHLLNNLMGLLVFAPLSLFKGARVFYKNSAFIIIVTGLLVWCFARDGNHIGASGWLFGLWSLAIARAFVEKNISNFIIALVVIICYGGMIYGVLPSQKSISFEAHLSGAIAGILCALIKFKRL